MTQQRDIVIIGSGMAGYTLLREIRKLNAEIGITLICADDGDFYSKPMLSNALTADKTPQGLVMQPADAMVKAQRFELVANTQVDAIDPGSRTVRAGDWSWSYRRLVLAVGANPIKLPIAGDASDDILSVNHLNDYRRFHTALQRAQRIAIIGPGLIGCEFANDLLAANRQVTVIGPDPWPISTLLPPETGRFLQQLLEQSGVRFYLQDTVQSVDKAEEAYWLRLQSGQEFAADLVLSAVGLRANLTLADGAGLDCRRGYRVDRQLQTSSNGIYALGDCAEVDGLHLPFILPIMQCARALAKTLTGNPTEVSYPVMPVAIKTPACPLVVAAPPAAAIAVEWQYDEHKDGLKALAYSNAELVGFALAGDAVSEKQALSQQLPALL